jgi:hypothetical protein
MADLARIDTKRRFRLGTRTRTRQGNEYIYCEGVASTAAGDFVAFGSGYKIGRKLQTTVLGSVGVAMGALVANRFGWVQVRGVHPAANVTTHSSGAGAPLFGTGTAGRAVVTPAANAGLFGAFTAADAGSNVGPVYLDNPVAHGPLS